MSVEKKTSSKAAPSKSTQVSKRKTTGKSRKTASRSKGKTARSSDRKAKGGKRAGGVKRGTAKRVKAGKKRRAPKKPTDQILLNLKITRKDRKVVAARAKRFVKGNLSAWLRFAGAHFKPTQAQLRALH
jgi:hypothetical protein